MASGYVRSDGKDLDLVLAPQHSGWPQASATEFFDGSGNDLNLRYAELSTGSAAAATEFVTADGSDLAARFAGYGTTNVQVATQSTSASGSAAAGYPSGTVTSSAATCSFTKGGGSYTYAWHCTNCTANSPNSATTTFSANVSASSTTNASAYCTGSDGVTSANTSPIPVTLTNTSPKSQDFSITAATWTNTGGTHVGYNASGGHGSATNTTLPDGTTIVALSDTTTSSTNTSFGISGFSSDPGQSYFSSVVANGQTRASSSATYYYNAGSATWTWPGSTIGFVSGDTYPCTLNF